MESVLSLIDKFKQSWFGETKQEVEGYILMSDKLNNRTLIMVKENEKCWRTKWFNNANNFIVPKESITKIFISNNN